MNKSVKNCQKIPKTAKKKLETIRDGIKSHEEKS